MKSITIHGVDDDLVQKIARKSKEHGASRNKTIKSLLEESLSDPLKTDREHEFSDLFGKWSEDEKARFDTAVRDFDRIDESDWESP